MGAVSDWEVMADSIAQPAMFAEIFDRHSATILQFLVRRAGSEAALLQTCRFR